MKNNMQKTKQTVLVIGAKGMLGQALVEVFKKDKSYAVIGWDREDVDILEEKKTVTKIEEAMPSIIINATGYNAVDKAEEKKEFEIAKKLNGKTPGYLAKLAKKLDAVFVNYSSDYVFDGEPEMPEPEGCSHRCSSCSLHDNFVPEIGFDEYAKTNPISNYGKSKVLGEKEVVKNGKKYYIVRLSKLFGKAGQSDLVKKSFFDVMLEAGKNPPAGGKSVSVVDEEISCFTYAPDLAQKTKEIIEAEKPYGIYHITNSDPCTWYEAVLELYKQAKIKTKVIPVSAEEFPRPARRPFYSALINTKINPLRSYKEALKEYLKGK